MSSSQKSRYIHPAWIAAAVTFSLIVARLLHVKSIVFDREVGPVLVLKRERIAEVRVAGQHATGPPDRGDGADHPCRLHVRLPAASGAWLLHHAKSFRHRG